jgi:hypothetical protein
MCEKCQERKPLTQVMLFYHDVTNDRRGRITKGILHLCASCTAETYNRYPLAFAAGNDEP